jgi:hypothetical protein|tara:strand:+ start:317 stop:538 length:222 start_codon:yes stop_codon:yes gene_type:complete
MTGLRFRRELRKRLLGTMSDYWWSRDLFENTKRKVFPEDVPKQWQISVARDEGEDMDPEKDMVVPELRRKKLG